MGSGLSGFSDARRGRGGRPLHAFRHPVLAGAALILLAAASPLHALADTVDPGADHVAAIVSVTADPAYGEYLAGDCITCHRRSGPADGIPPIAGLPVEHFVKALVEYRLRIRDNEVMTVRASRLSDEEIAALAHHFASQKH